MTNNLYVYFYLGEYQDNPELGLFSVDPDSSDVRVKKDKSNFCSLVVKENEFRTDDLELELNGGAWMASACFDLAITQDGIGDLRGAIKDGQATLRLGEYTFTSNASDNETLFRED